jgi:putative YphP/YqiW family bacilliredoxin
MKEELTENGFTELLTANEVDSRFNGPVPLVAINSVCGCSAGSARPGCSWRLPMPVNPIISPQVLPGLTRSGEKIREHLLPYPPSSPSIALLKDGKLVHLLRHMIEG